MTALPVLDIESASTPARALMHAVKASYGTVPALIRVMANSPALLRGYLDLSGALGSGLVPPDVRERIAILVALENGCVHCLTGHSRIAARVLRIPADEIAAARQASSEDERVRAMLRFASAVNRRRGDVSERELAEARAVGVTDEELTEIVGHVVVNVLTNYVAKTARIEPEAPLDERDDDVVA